MVRWLGGLVDWWVSGCKDRKIDVYFVYYFRLFSLSESRSVTF